MLDFEEQVGGVSHRQAPPVIGALIDSQESPAIGEESDAKCIPQPPGDELEVATVRQRITAAVQGGLAGIR